MPLRAGGRPPAFRISQQAPPQYGQGQLDGGENIPPDPHRSLYLPRRAILTRQGWKYKGKGHKTLYKANRRGFDCGIILPGIWKGVTDPRTGERVGCPGDLLHRKPNRGAVAARKPQNGKQSVYTIHENRQTIQKKTKNRHPAPKTQKNRKGIKSLWHKGFCYVCSVLLH